MLDKRICEAYPSSCNALGKTDQQNAKRHFEGRGTYS